MCEDVSCAIGVFGRENVCDGKWLCRRVCGSREESEGTVVDFHQTRACWWGNGSISGASRDYVGSTCAAPPMDLILVKS